MLDSLPGLTSLSINHCRKLTPAVSAILAAAQRNSSCLVHVSMQRCYQVTSASLHTVLSGACAPSAGLTAFAASHIDMSGLCSASAAALSDSEQSFASSDSHVPLLRQHSSNLGDSTDLASDSSGMGDSGDLHVRSPLHASMISSACSSVRVLALHSCSGVSCQALAKLLGLAPHVEMLLLGGSALQLDVSCSDDSVFDAVTAAVKAVHAEARSHIRDAVGEQQRNASIYGLTSRPRAKCAL
jgi:hypothetical protein